MISYNADGVPYRPVTLTRWEQHTALYFAHKRWEEAIRQGLQNKLMKDTDELVPHLEGVLGETAYAKAANVYYLPTVNTFKKPDVNGKQVRLRTKHWYELPVRDDDKPEDTFVLVTMEWSQPDQFRVYEGEITGREAKQHPEWYKNHGGFEYAYFVPQAFLFRRGLRIVGDFDSVIPWRLKKG